MAASKTCYARASHKFLSCNLQPLATDSMIFELDESDVWNLAARSASPAPNSRVSAWKASGRAARGGAGSPATIPMNVPDWSKILKDEYREARVRDSDDDADEAYADETGNRIPPHEFLARQMARTRIASFSVHEGTGRRDLRRVRNAIWQKTGFQD